MAMLNKHSPEVNRMLCSFEGDAPLLQAAPFILADRDRDRDEYALLGSLALPFRWLLSLLHCINSRSGFGSLPLAFHKRILTVWLSWQRVPVSLLRAVAAEWFLCLLPLPSATSSFFM